jgi:hypothetical protein
MKATSSCSKDSDPKEYRLRVGDYRIRFHDLGDTGLPTVPLLRVARYATKRYTPSAEITARLKVLTWTQEFVLMTAAV